jgi:hypothetical protein
MARSMTEWTVTLMPFAISSGLRLERAAIWAILGRLFQGHRARSSKGRRTGGGPFAKRILLDLELLHSF